MKFSRGHIKSAKLTPAQVYEMRVLYATNQWTQGALSRKYQVGTTQVGRIVRGEAWQQFHNPAEDVVGEIPPILGKSSRAIEEEAAASLQNVLDRMKGDIAKAREQPLDTFLDDKRADKYLEDEK